MVDPWIDHRLNVRSLNDASPAAMPSANIEPSATAVTAEVPRRSTASGNEQHSLLGPALAARNTIAVRAWSSPTTRATSPASGCSSLVTSTSRAATAGIVCRRMRLQTMPAVAARLVDVTSEEQPDAGDVARVVGLDHALTAMVLRAANAGPSSECCSLPEAVDRLGTSAVTAVALGSMLAEGIAAGEASFNERTFRRWSIHGSTTA